MRRLLLALPLALVFTPAARPDEATDLRDRAIKAYAKDPADLKKLRVHIVKARGVSRLTPEPTVATQEVAAVFPDSMRVTWEFGAGEKKNIIIQAASGDRGWRQGPVLAATDFTIEALNDFRADAYAIWVSTLITLSDKESKLAPGGTGKVNDHPVVGLKVSRRSWPEITLYFDAKSGLLRKMAYSSREAGLTLRKAMVFDGHKETGGLMLPTSQSMFVNDREIFTWAQVEYTFPDTIDPKTFQKP